MVFSPASVRRSRFRSRNLLFSAQHEDGYWCGELEADTTLESDYILLHTLLGTGNAERFRKAANSIIQHQNEDGGWSIYAGGPSNVSASVKAYFGLKLAGFAADHPVLLTFLFSRSSGRKLKDTAETRENHKHFLGNSRTNFARMKPENQNRRSDSGVFHAREAPANSSSSGAWPAASRFRPRGLRSDKTQAA